jgi:tetratricopeptide (TPR) repeat protein
MNYQAGERTRLKRQRMEQAIQLALENRWHEAAAVNRSIISLFPSDVDAYNRLGKALMEMGDHDEARSAYMKTLALEPGNVIARKNLARLGAIKAGSGRYASRNLNPSLFIAESGKTGIVLLNDVAAEKRANLTAGDSVNLKPEGSTILVETPDGERLGEIEPRLGLRLSRLIEGGNRYVAAVAGLSNGEVRVIIREIYQHPSQQGKPSFPALTGENFRPYVKERLLRHDVEEEEVSEETEEAEEWEQETVATEGDMTLQDYQETAEGEGDDEEEYEE